MDVRRQLRRQFSGGRFEPKRDIAGIILNRWGRSRLVQAPGWFCGTAGRLSPRDVVSKGFGRIAIGHSELNGQLNETGAVVQGSGWVNSSRCGLWAAVEESLG